MPMPSSPFAPERIPSYAGEDLPESWQYRVKRKLLGRPLVSEQLSGERLSKPIAFGVLAPDMISSSAYGTEEMLAIMVPIIGIGAFTMVIPITIAILAVLVFVLLSYLQVIGAYPRAGGSYVVARENFGPKVAQIAAVALLIDYIVTVAVQTSAGTAALTSAFKPLIPFTVVITVAVTLLMLYGNLRGIREAGRVFALPTYFFVISLGLVVLTGIVKGVTGHLAIQPLPSATALGYQPGHLGQGPLLGLGVFFLLKSFANGGASLTGLEAVSNGISSFRKPAARNGRITLTIMCCILGFLVAGTSLLAYWTHAVPYAAGTPTVVSQEVQAVVGAGVSGTILFLAVQLATVLILFTGGNTSFNGFPYLASFVAGDSFLPRQLTKRGHRLAFSNGIFVLAAMAIILIIVFQARLNALVGLYAIGVFTGFCIAGSGMVKHHLRERGRRWRLGLMVNGFSAVLSFAVVIILLVTKFTEGAWIIAVVSPPMYLGLLRLHRQYASEASQLESGALAAAQAPVLPRHVVVVMVGELNLAAARTIQYARVLRPDEMRAVHFNTNASATERLKGEWERLGLAHLPLDLVEVSDRRIDRAAAEYVAEVTADGRTECAVLLPRYAPHSRLQRLRHDRTAGRIAGAVGAVPHVTATIVPFNPTPANRLKRPRRDGAKRSDVAASNGFPRHRTSASDIDRELAQRAAGATAIEDIEWRRRVKVAGRIRSLRVETAQGTANLECEITDETGNLLLVFMGRRRIPGVELGTRLLVEGTVGSWKHRLAILNPDYELITTVTGDRELAR
jgi:amino acid transporter